MPLFDDYGCFAVAQDHPLAGREQVSSEEIREQKVYFNLRNSVSMQEIFHKLIRSGIAPENLVCVEGTGTSVALALAYGGMAALPRTFKTMDYPGTVYVDNESPVVHMYFGLAWRRDNETEPVKRFADCCAGYSWPGVKQEKSRAMTASDEGAAGTESG